MNITLCLQFQICVGIHSINFNSQWKIVQYDIYRLYILCWLNIHGPKSSYTDICIHIYVHIQVLDLLIVLSISPKFSYAESHLMIIFVYLSWRQFHMCSCFIICLVKQQVQLIYQLLNRSLRRLNFLWWGCWGLCPRHKPAGLAHYILFCACVCFCHHGPFNCISFHKFSWQLSTFSLCSSGLVLPLNYIYLFETPSALI